MEDWERQIIFNNIDKLIQDTTCNDALLNKFLSVRVLSQDDIEAIHDISPSNSRQASKFYTILVTRKNSFKKLIRFLEETNQTGAANTLTSEEAKHKPDGFYQTHSIKYDECQILGEGSSGTVVYKGTFGDRVVAVKRINVNSKDDKEKTVKEIDILKICDVHENIVRYFCTKVVKHFILIVLEHCDFTLKDWVGNKTINIINIQPLEVLRQVTLGMEWLHGKKIVHRDLKPENILLVAEVSKVKISDFGMSRKMVGESRYLSNIAAGTEGWVAPETLQQVVLGTTAGKYKFTYESDLFALGCVYYYVLTDGIHAFGDPLRRNGNIMDGKPQINYNDILYGCSQNAMFIKLMISLDPSSRPSCSALLACPIFWSAERRVKFLEDLKEPHDGPLKLILKLEWTNPCKIDHAPDNKSLFSLGDGNGGKSGCVVPFAYLACQSIKEYISEYYYKSYEFSISVLYEFMNEPAIDWLLHQLNQMKYSKGNQRNLHDTVCNRDAERRNIINHRKASLQPISNIEIERKVENPKVVVRSRSVSDAEIIQSTEPINSSIRKIHVPEEVKETSIVDRFIKDFKRMDCKLYAKKLSNMVQHEKLETIQQVLEHATKVKNIKEIWDINSKSLLHVAVEYREPKVVEYLIHKLGFSAKLSDDRYTSDIIHTCIKDIHKISSHDFDNKCKIIKLLVTAHPELINSKDEDQQTPLHLATERDFENGKQMEFIQMLLSFIPNVNAKDHLGQTPIHCCFKSLPLAPQLMDIIKLLVESYADPDAIDFNGNTLLHLATFHAKPELYHELVGYLFSIGKTNSFSAVSLKGNEKNRTEIDKEKEIKGTVLHYAVSNLEPQRATLELFQQSEVDFNAVSAKGETVLFSAIKGGRNAQFLDMLIEFGAEWRGFNENRSTALHYAASWVNLSALKHLLSLGLDVNARNAFGNTPLHEVFLQNSGNKAHEIVSELLKHGADANLRNKDNELPVHLAIKVVTYWKLEQRTRELLENATVELTDERMSMTNEIPIRKHNNTC